APGVGTGLARRAAMVPRAVARDGPDREDGRGRQQLDHRAWRIERDGDRRRPSRFRAERRLARRRARRDRGSRRAADVQRAHAEADDRRRRLGGRGRGALRQEPAGILGRERQSRRRQRAQSRRQAGNTPARRAARARHRHRSHARRARRAREDSCARLSRAAHRTGTGPRIDEQGDRRGARHVRRGAPHHPLHRPGRAFGLDADPDAPRRLPGGGTDRARMPRDRAPLHAARHARRLHGRDGEGRARYRHGGAGRVRDLARPAVARRGRPRAHARRREGRRGSRGPRQQRHGRVAAALADRSASVRPAPDRALCRGRARGHGRRAAAAFGPAARCRRDGAAHARRDDVRVFVERLVALQRGRHPEPVRPADDRSLPAPGRQGCEQPMTDRRPSTDKPLTENHHMRALIVAVLMAGVGVAADQQSQPSNPYASTYQAAPSRTTVIRNATILTAAGPQIDSGSVLLQNGKVAAVGQTVDAPADAVVIDAAGKWVTPGVIDTHSHLGVYAAPGIESLQDGNEMTSPNTAEVSTEHAIWPQDPQFELALAGGVTTMHILPGSANLFGGRSVTVKNVPARTADAMKFPSAPYGLKIACGENPMRVYGSKNTARATRMGTVAGYRKAWQSATEYRAKWQEWKKGGSDPAKKPDRNLQLATLQGGLGRESHIQQHCY